MGGVPGTPGQHNDSDQLSKLTAPIAVAAAKESPLQITPFHALMYGRKKFLPKKALH